MMATVCKPLNATSQLVSYRPSRSQVATVEQISRSRVKAYRDLDLLSMSVNVHDGDGLEEGDKDQTSSSGEGVKDLDPVLAGSRHEKQADQVTDDANSG